MNFTRTDKAPRRKLDSAATEYVDRLSALSLGETTDEQETRFHNYVRNQLRGVGSFEVAFTSDGQPIIETSWSQSKLAAHAEFRDQILEVCQSARQTRTLQVGNPEGYKLTTLAAPIICLNKVRRIWLVVIPRDEKQRLAATRDFQTAARYYSLWRERRLGSRADERMATMSRVIDLVAVSHRCEDTTKASQALAAELKKESGINNAAVALPQKDRLEVVAISGHAHFHHKGQINKAILEACNESLLHPSGAIWPADHDDAEHCLLAHERLASIAGDAYAGTQCLRTVDDRLVAVLAWTGQPTDTLDARHARLMSAASVPVAESLNSVGQLQRGVLQRFAKRAVELARRRTGIAVLAALALLVAAMFIPVPYRIRCTCKAEPVTRRFAVAPYQGIVERGFVKAGDVVNEGQLLARMDARELRWELASVTAKEHQTKQERNVYLADEKVPQAMMARMEGDQFSSRRSLLEHRESNMVIRSPINGFILSGDLERNENAPVEMGDTLYEIGPCSPIKVQAFVPSDDIRYVKQGQQTKIWIDGFGTEPIAGAITRLLPRSQEFEGKNVFVAEIEVPNKEATLRPGMRGIARITCEQQPLGWNIFHKPWEHLQSRLSW